jgi:hypothetical protein
VAVRKNEEITGGAQHPQFISIYGNSNVNKMMMNLKMAWGFPIVCGHLTQIAVDFRSNFTPEPGKLHQIAHTLPVVGSTTENNARVFPTLIWVGGFKYFMFKSVGTMISPTTKPIFLGMGD